MDNLLKFLSLIENKRIKYFTYSISEFDSSGDWYTLPAGTYIKGVRYYQSGEVELFSDLFYDENTSYYPNTGEFIQFDVVSNQWTIVRLKRTDCTCSGYDLLHFGCKCGFICKE